MAMILTSRFGLANVLFCYIYEIMRSVEQPFCDKHLYSSCYIVFYIIVISLFNRENAISKLTKCKKKFNIFLKNKKMVFVFLLTINLDFFLVIHFVLCNSVLKVLAVIFAFM